MTSPLSTLNTSLERLKLSVKMRKRQRRNWMQQLMDDSAARNQNHTANKSRVQDTESSVDSNAVTGDTTGSKTTCYRPAEQMRSGLFATGFVMTQNRTCNSPCH